MAAVNCFLFWKNRLLIVGGHSDFVSFYAAGKIVATGRLSDLFDPSIQFEIQRRFSRFVDQRGGPFPYVHPLFEALLFVPFSIFGYFSAYLLWTTINLVILFCLPDLLRPAAPVLNQIPRWLWAISLLAFMPVLSVLVQGQDDVMLLLLSSLAFVALHRARSRLAGAWLGLAMFRPQFALPLFIILMGQGDWRFLTGFFLSFGAIAAVTIALFGWSNSLHYPVHVLAWEKASDPIGSLLRVMPNLHGLCDRLFSFLHSDLAIAVLTAAVSLVVLRFAAVLCRRRGAELPSVTFGAAILATILVSYHAFVHDLVLLILAFIGFSEWIWCIRRPFTDRIPYLLVLALLLPPVSYPLLSSGLFALVPATLVLLFMWILVRTNSPVPADSPS
jgi:hypothetical protein